MVPPLASALPLILLLVAGLAGCGGGGSSSTEAAGAPTTIAGSAVKGPVKGATVTAYQVIGGMMGSVLGQATTGDDGAYSMSIPMPAGPVAMRMSGGTYIDEATGATVAMAPGQVMTAVIPSLVQGTNHMQITPLTSMAQAMAVAMPGGMTTANIDAAHSAVGSYFMVSDLQHTAPMNPLVPGSSASATPAMLNYGMVLAGISQYAASAGVPAGTMVGGLMADAADGVLDGKAGTTPITLGGLMNGGMMQPDAGRSGLAASMLEFMQSESNRSGAAAAAASPLMQRLASAGGSMH